MVATLPFGRSDGDANVEAPSEKKSHSGSVPKKPGRFLEKWSVCTPQGTLFELPRRRQCLSKLSPRKREAVSSSAAVGRASFSACMCTMCAAGCKAAAAAAPTHLIHTVLAEKYVCTSASCNMLVCSHNSFSPGDSNAWDQSRTHVTGVSVVQREEWCVACWFGRSGRVVGYCCSALLFSRRPGSERVRICTRPQLRAYSASIRRVMRSGVTYTFFWREVCPACRQKMHSVGRDQAVGACEAKFVTFDKQRYSKQHGYAREG